MNKLSVILLNYNDSHYLINWIDKFYKSDYEAREAELIIVDDCSTDQSRELVNCLIQKYPPNIKVVQTKVNGGPFKAFMAGVEISTGNFVVAWSADDELLPRYIKQMQRAIYDFPLTDIFLCNAIVEREGREYKKIGYSYDAYISPEHLFGICKSGRSSVLNFIGVVIRKTQLMNCWDGRGEYLPTCFDEMYTYFTAFKTGMVILGDCLVKYRASFKGFGSSGGWRRDRISARLILTFSKTFPAIRNYIFESGIWSTRRLLWAHMGLFIVPMLPRFLRYKIYERYYKKHF